MPSNDIPAISSTTPFESKIFEASLAAIPQAFKRLYQDKNITVVSVAGEQAFREMFREKGKVIFPCFAYMTVGMGVNHASYNRQALKHLGIRGGLDKDGHAWITYHLTPVVVAFRVIFFAQKQEDMYHFANMWFTNEKKLNFKLRASGSTNFIVNLRFDSLPDLVFPNLDASISEVGELFKLETQINLQTYVGHYYRVPGIRERHVTFTPVEKTIYDQVTNLGSKVDVHEFMGDVRFEVFFADPTNPEL